jgi:SAM-dependent methyltransferase
MDKPILDPCCGGKMFWFDKHNPHVLYCDNRRFSGALCDGRIFEVKPDMLVDFSALPFEDESFWHVVFDPPHITHGGDNSWIVKKYGKLPPNWKSIIKAGFDECWRVLRTNGTLVFKWNEDSVTVREIIKTIDREPLYGQKERKGNKTHWMCFVKLMEREVSK